MFVITRGFHYLCKGSETTHELFLRTLNSWATQFPVRLGNRRAGSQAGLGLDRGAVLHTCRILLWKGLLSRLCKLPADRRAAILLLPLNCERIPPMQVPALRGGVWTPGDWALLLTLPLAL